MAECLVCHSPIPIGRRSDAVYCTDECGAKARRKRHYQNHPDGFRAKRKYQREHRYEAGIVARAKHRAKLIGVPFALTTADIVVPERCPVLGITLQRFFGVKGGYRPDSPSIDRIVNERGYVPGNIRIISMRANLLKSDATVAELEAVLNDLRSRQ